MTISEWKLKINCYLKKIYLRLMSFKVIRLLPSYAIKYSKKDPKNIIDLPFYHRIGLAAGVDNSGQDLFLWVKLGYGFVEVGDVTPRAFGGSGYDDADIGTDTFASLGIHRVAVNLTKRPPHLIVGISLIHLPQTVPEKRFLDYIYSMQVIFRYVDYISIDIMWIVRCENEWKIKQDFLLDFIGRISREKLFIQKEHHKKVPLLFKLSPDIDEKSLLYLVELFMRFQVDGVILRQSDDEVSGKNFLKRFKKIANNHLTIIISGPSFHTDEVLDYFKDGARLVQIEQELSRQGLDFVKDFLRTTAN